MSSNTSQIHSDRSNLSPYVNHNLNPVNESNIVLVEPSFGDKAKSLAIKVGKIAILVLSALVLSALSPFNASIIFLGGMIGVSSLRGDWFRNRIEQVEAIFASNVTKIALATLVFLPPAALTYSFCLGAHVGLLLARDYESNLPGLSQ